MGFPDEFVSLDVSVALDRVGGDEELLKEIAQIFLDQCPEALADVRMAAEANDAEALEKAAHALKGSVANFGAESARSAALRIEDMARSGALDGVPRALAELDAALHTLNTELERLTAG